MASRSDSAWGQAVQQTLEKDKLAPRTEPALSQSLSEGTFSNPDQEAKVIDLSRRAEMPRPLVEEDPQSAERAATLLELDQAKLTRESPVTAESLTDREFAKVAHDDVENLSGIERFTGDIVQRFEKGERIRELGKLGFLSATGRATPENERRIQRLQARDQRDVDFGIPQEGVGGFFLGIPGAVAEVGPQLVESTVQAVEGGVVGGIAAGAAGLAFGGVGAIPAAVSGFTAGANLGLFNASFQAEAGNFFLEARELRDEEGNPVEPLLLNAITLGVGTVAGGIEMFGTGKLLKHIPGLDRLTGQALRATASQALRNPGFRKVVGGLFKSAAAGAATEGITEGLQESVSIAGLLAAMQAIGETTEDLTFEGIDPETGEPIVLHGTDAFWARVISAGRQGAQAGAGIAATGKTTRFLTESERAQDAVNRIPGIERLRNAGKKSKLRERSPEEFKKHARQVAEQSGQENVYIEPEIMREFFETLEETEAQEVFEAIPDLQEQDAVVGQTGADFVIPFELWLAHMSPTSAGDQLSTGIRFDPLEMTQREAEIFEEQTVETFGDIQELAGVAREEDVLLGDVRGRLRGELAKVHPPSVVEPLLELSMARLETRAERLGVPVSQLLEEEGLFRIEAPGEELAPLPVGLSERLDREAVLRVIGDLREGVELDPELPEAEAERRIVETAIDQAGLALESDEEAILGAVLPERKEFEAVDEEGVQGAIRGLLEPDLNDVVIRFTDASNLSTFLHESGHLWLAQLNKDAKAAGEESQLGRDIEVVKMWLGVEDEAGLFTDEAQENWARATEAYYFEGKAPTLKLQPVFQRFTSWLVRIYKRLSAIPRYKGQLVPEIREVMDRLIASDIAIRETAEALALEPMDTETLGMNPEEAQAYEAALIPARAESLAQMQKAMMGELKRQTTKEWKNLKAGIREEVERDVNSRPVFQAQHWLERGEALPDQTVPDVPHAKIDRQTLIEIYGKDILKVLKTGRFGVVQKNGLHPDQVAEIFDFPDGNALVEALQAAGKRVDVISAETDALMLKRHGKFQTSGDLEAAAVEALSNKKEIALRVIEERALAKKAGGLVTPLQVARRAAERIVQETKFRSLKPHRYRMAAQRAGRDALEMAAAGEDANAQRAKRSQIMNVFLESESRKAIEQANRNLNRLNSIQSPKSRARIGKAGGDFLEQIDGMLDRFNLRKNQTLKRLDKMRGLASWITEQEQNGDSVIITEKLRDEAFGIGWKDLPVSELQDLRDAVDNIAHLARRKNEFLANRERRDRDAVRRDLIDSIGTNAKPGKEVNDLNRDRFIDRMKSGLLSAESALVKVEFLVDLLDGGKPSGFWRRNVFVPVKEAQARRLDLSKEYTEAFAKAMNTLMKGKTKEYHTKQWRPQIQANASKAEVLAIAFNVFNDGNLRRLVEGNGWSEASIMSLLDQTMNKADWDFVVDTLKLINTLWPQIEDQERRLTGVTPRKVIGRIVSTRFGDIDATKFGYFPVVYDPDQSKLAYQRAEKGLYEGLENHFARPITGHGHTIERTNVAGPLLISMDVIPSHLDQVIHDLTHREVLTQLDKLLSSQEIEEAFDKTTLGKEYFRIFRPWLQGMAQDRIVDNRSISGVAKLLRTLRTSTTSFTLGFRASTLLMQSLGHSNAIGVLRTRLPNWQKYYVNGTKKALLGFAPNREQSIYSEISDVSGEMRNRINNIDRDLRDVVRRNAGKVTASARVKRSAMELIGKMQLFSVDIPVWLTAYEGGTIELGLTHEQAIDFADSVVSMSQGAAGAKDLAAIQRADEGYKQFTLFYSYMNTVYNQVAVLSAGRVRNVKDVPGFLAAYGFFIMGPAVGAALIRSALGSDKALPEDEADFDDWALWLVSLGLSEMVGTIPFLRDGAGLVSKVFGTGKFFVGRTPTQRLMELAGDLAVTKDATDGIFDGLRVVALISGAPGDYVLKLAEEQIRGEE